MTCTLPPPRVSAETLSAPAERAGLAGFLREKVDGAIEADREHAPQRGSSLHISRRA